MEITYVNSSNDVVKTQGAVTVRNKQRASFGPDYRSIVTFEIWDCRSDGNYLIGGGRVYGKKATDEQCIDEWVRLSRLEAEEVLEEAYKEQHNG